ncbi:hypothetical protein V5O48_010997 [Marasmius crinis-equi]|uniref:Uncharacterized protein n=1 Tax=Marasmius crinis-equi TaxID=585013 RepID=A0ABR3F6S5_9AGAR
MIVWEGLRSVEASAYHQKSTDEWYSQLTTDIVKWLDIQLPSVAKLDAHTYFPTLYSPGQETYTICEGRTSKIYPDDPRSWACMTATQLAIRWLKFPAQKPWQYAARITRRLYDIGGPAILLLRGTWFACRKPQEQFLTAGSSLSLSSIDSSFDRHVQQLTIFRVGTAENDLLKRIDNICGSFRNIDARNQYTFLLSSIPSTAPSSYTISNAIQSPSPIIAGPIPSPSSYFDEAVADQLIKKLEVLYPFLDEGLNPPQSKANDNIGAFISRVKQNVDKLLPFRDLARSRSLILADNGPFSPNMLRTREGMFSALMFRGLLFNTKYLADPRNPCVFRNLTDWNIAMERARSNVDDIQESYFCDKNAYGSCAKDRVLDNATAYWKASNNPELNSWLLGEETFTFERLFSHLQRPEFPAFGKLTSFLLAADYATAGAVPMPSAHEVGCVIYKVGLGSLQGMKRMGFPCDDADGTGDGFAFVYDHFRKRIDLDRQDQMGFNVFMMEHCLCKDRRLDGVLWNAIYKSQNT